MNSVELIGRLVRDPEIRYTSADNKAVATFTLAVDRDGQKDANGKKLTDYPRVTVFGRAAETIEKYVKKGKQIGIQGRIQTGSYTDKNGNKVYTTDVVAFKVDLISDGQQPVQQQQYQAPPQYQQPYQQPVQYPQQTYAAPAINQVQPVQEPMQVDFTEIDEDVPF